MAIKLNCWEYHKCGREPGGAKIIGTGVCPSTTETSANGINGGKNGGRICWAIAGTFSDENVKGTLAKEKFSCSNCEFFKYVNKDENINAYEILTPTKLNKFLANRRKELSF